MVNPSRLCRYAATAVVSLFVQTLFRDRLLKIPRACRASTTAIVVISMSVLAGCSGFGDFGRDLEGRAPDRMRGTSVGYDITNLTGRPQPKPLPPVDRRDAITAEPTMMMVWWQTPDGVVHHEQVLTRGDIIDAERYAGSLWVEVTPLGGTPKRLTGTGSQPVE